ncbi:hypothetical protein [Enterobacter sp.]|uniref:hypothetical protein n=1 Tax=Enterobacter sp. TaxID=42895 RepID=UPI00296E928C|nr:hypothetical protein [Enterobacter sp.]
MNELLIFIVCIIVSIFCYKKIAKNCRNKGRGKFFTILTASLSSLVVFVCIMAVFSGKSTSKDGNNDSEAASLKVTEWMASPADVEKVNELIENDLRENPELTKRILQEISSYDKDDAAKMSAQLTYQQYGVSNKEFTAVIQESNCPAEYKAKNKQAVSWYNSQDWRPLTDFPNYMWKKEKYRRDLVNYESGKRQLEITNEFSACTLPLLSKVEHLSRTDAKPYMAEPEMPVALQCVQKNGGNYDACY